MANLDDHLILSRHWSRDGTLSERRHRVGDESFIDCLVRHLEMSTLSVFAQSVE